MELAQQSKKYTNQVIVILKTIATIFVVYVHSGNIYGYSGIEMPRVFYSLSTLAACGVPIFMTISAYLLFSKEFSWKDNTNKKIHSLLVPYFIWNGIWILFELVI